MRRFLKGLAVTGAVALFAAAFYADHVIQHFTPEKKIELATTLNLPYTFTSGGIIYASQINANFQAIRAVINALDDQNIANASITGSAKLIDGTVSTAKLAPDAVDTTRILDGTILPADLAANAVTTAKILDANVTTSKIADANVTNAKLVDSSIAEVKLDINSAPVDQGYLYWNAGAGKLDYRTLGTSCAFTISTRGTIATNVAPQTLYNSFVGSATNATESSVGGYVVPVTLKFNTMYVAFDSGTTAASSTVFTLRVRGTSDTGTTCTIAGGGTFCQVIPGSPLSEVAGTQLVLKAAAAANPSNTAFTATVCVSPY